MLKFTSLLCDEFRRPSSLSKTPSFGQNPPNDSHQRNKSMKNSNKYIQENRK